ncbi:hypothetical protein ES332_A04G103300v1 [Gossypium tomentosum]|uniref:Uncharacterized protein n=1 Tax=Gossypium tomentosum TaxID=34277 RepID=A0A5D2QX63_GOSTO|nr:hypothetical protein ES332_A04G103300v1 [Gossypium tomentosum]
MASDLFGFFFLFIGNLHIDFQVCRVDQLDLYAETLSEHFKLFNCNWVYVVVN